MDTLNDQFTKANKIGESATQRERLKYLQKKSITQVQRGGSEGPEERGSKNDTRLGSQPDMIKQQQEQVPQNKYMGKEIGSIEMQRQQSSKLLQKQQNNTLNNGRSSALEAMKEYANVGVGDSDRVLDIAKQSSIRLLLSPSLSKGLNGIDQYEEKKMKYEEMQVEYKLKQLLLNKVKPLSSIAMEFPSPLQNPVINNKTAASEESKSTIPFSPKVPIHSNRVRKTSVSLQASPNDYLSVNLTTNFNEIPPQSSRVRHLKNEESKELLLIPTQSNNNNSQSSLYQQYMSRLMQQKKYVPYQEQLPQSQQHSMKSDKQNVKYQNKQLPQIEDSHLLHHHQHRQSVHQYQTGSEQIKSLKYPASSKELQEFNKQQETNLLRFAKMVISEKDHLLGTSRLKTKNSIIFNNHIQFFANSSKQIKQDSVREKINGQSQLDQFERFNLQCQGLVEESMREDKSKSNSPEKRMKKNKSQYQSSMIIEIQDPSEIQRPRPLDKNSMTTLSASSNFNSIYSSSGATDHLSNKKRAVINSVRSNQEITQRSRKNIEREKEAQNFQVDLAKYTNLVDHLQQQKLTIRQQILFYLSTQTKLTKFIAKNCLMDVEQFVFFIMSFFQFCIEDTFYQFKKQFQDKISGQTLNSTRQSNNNNSPSSNNQNNSTKNQNSSMQPPPEFKFNQKIPEEIIMPIVEAISDTLQGLPLKCQRDMSPKKVQSKFFRKSDSPTIEREATEGGEIAKTKNGMLNFKLQLVHQLQEQQQKQQKQEQLPGAPQEQQQQDSLLAQTIQSQLPSILKSKPQSHRLLALEIPNSNLKKSQVNIAQSIDLRVEQNKFIQNIIANVNKYILPHTIIDRIGGFARLKQMIIEGIKSLNVYINNASKMNPVEENNEELIDKHLMPAICALINQDRDTLHMQIELFLSLGQSLSHYDFFTIKRIFWDIMSSIKLDSNLKFHIILQIENIRFYLIKHPYEGRVPELASSLMKSYEICNYFRNSNIQDNIQLLQGIFDVMYHNQSYQHLSAQLAPKIKFQFNEKFFDHISKFLKDELKEIDSRSVMDLHIRLQKLKMKAGVMNNIFTIFREDTETFFSEFQPFMKLWVQKYNQSNSLMDAKVMDFKFLEMFIKWALNKQDLYSLMDTEPGLMHFVVSEFTVSFWIKGFVAFFEEMNLQKSQYQSLISFITQYLLAKKDDEILNSSLPSSPVKRDRQKFN